MERKIVIGLTIGMLLFISGYLMFFLLKELEYQDIIVVPAQRNGNVISAEFLQPIELQANHNYEIVIPKDWDTTDNLTIKIREIK